MTVPHFDVLVIGAGLSGVGAAYHLQTRCPERSYAILEHELTRVGADGDGKRAGQLLDLGGPALDFVSLAEGMGVPATRATTAEELAEQLQRAFAEPGPHLIDAVVPPLL